MQHSYTVALDQRHRMYLPAGLRHALGVEPGDKVSWAFNEAAALMINPVPTPEHTFRTTLVREASDRDADPVQDRQRVAALFRQLQERDAFRETVDPVAWQREQRKERRLPGRSADEAA